jgi:glycosyltransferase involved in cell wall biosynthesis
VNHFDAPHRIVFCITELEPGGAERCLVELVTRVDRGEFEPLVYCLGPRPPGNANSLVDALERAGVAVRFFGATHSVQFPWVLRKLSRQLRVDSPRIVQAFLFHANVLSALAARRAGVPHVVTGIRVAERRSRWRPAVERWTARWVDCHVCVSQSVRDFSVLNGLSDAKLMVIPNGVDAERFAATRPCRLTDLGLLPGRNAITYLGRLDEQKGLQWMLEHMPPILARLSDHDLLLVGAGPERASLEQLATRLCIAERVHFAGFRDDVPEILAASDLLVLTSRWEGMPNVVLEAMASGKPVVATDVEGVSELLGPLSGEQTVRPGDAKGFVQKVVTIASDSSIGARLGAQNRARAQQHFSLAAMATNYQLLYRSLLAQRK